MVAPNLPQMGQKRLGPLEKPLRMADMCFASKKTVILYEFNNVYIYILCMSVMQQIEQTV
jgi:hypothetical protein